MSAVLRSFIVQALEQKSEVLEHIFSTMLESGEIKLRSVTRISSLLREVMEPFDSMKIVIDGLDECSDAVELVYSLLKLIDLGTLNIDLLIFSRQDKALQRALGVQKVLNVSPEDTQLDLSIYLENNIEGFQHLLKDDHETAHVKATLLRQAVRHRYHGLLVPQTTFVNTVNRAEYFCGPHWWSTA